MDLHVAPGSTAHFGFRPGFDPRCLSVRFSLAGHHGGARNAAQSEESNRQSLQQSMYASWPMNPPLLCIELQKSRDQADSLPELAQHETDMQSFWERARAKEPVYICCGVACSAIKNMKDSCVYFKSIDGLLRNAIAVKEQLNSARR
uniref:Uncharacterized protein n=1 Tax=Sphaerodactylus townsendi TaxID=933632 RepID=A0ACB8F0G9_9SAUR